MADVCRKCREDQIRAAEKEALKKLICEKIMTESSNVLNALQSKLTELQADCSRILRSIPQQRLQLADFVEKVRRFEVRRSTAMPTNLEQLLNDLEGEESVPVSQHFEYVSWTYNFDSFHLSVSFTHDEKLLETQGLPDESLRSVQEWQCHYCGVKNSIRNQQKCSNCTMSRGNLGSGRVQNSQPFRGSNIN